MLHFGAVDETTRRLVERCLRVGWLRDGDGEREGEGEVQGEKKKLGIGGNAKAAESSLSVLEVAAHREKPGVQTPSLSLGKDRDKDGGGEETGHPPEAETEDRTVGNGVVINADMDRRDKDKTDLDPELGGLTSPFEVEEADASFALYN